MIEYPVCLLSAPDELSGCQPFAVDRFQWRCVYRPTTFGRMAYLPGQGLLVEMTCQEQNPLRTMSRPQDNVCQDSAMEAFVAFPESGIGGAFVPGESTLYINFEVNANGAMRAEYGRGRENRAYITPQEYALSNVSATVYADHWTASFCIPWPLIERLYGVFHLAADDVFYCNFYKISENPDAAHYACFSPIDSTTPDFHVPRCFARAVVTDTGS